MVSVKVILIVVAIAVVAIEAKIYKRCDLAKELKNKYKLPAGDISKWVCIAKHESDYNTRAVNRQSGDHGIFQISQIWWCSPPGKGKGCGKPCSAFEDDNIADDVACAKKIKQQQGFTAWVAYNKYCTGNTASYTKGCF